MYNKLIPLFTGLCIVTDWSLQYDGVIGRYRHTPYLVDLVNSGSLIPPDLKINISERFVDPGARDLLYIPYSGHAVLNVYGLFISPCILSAACHVHTTNNYRYPQVLLLLL